MNPPDRLQVMRALWSSGNCFMTWPALLFALQHHGQLVQASITTWKISGSHLACKFIAALDDVAPPPPPPSPSVQVLVRSRGLFHGLNGETYAGYSQPLLLPHAGKESLTLSLPPCSKKEMLTELCPILKPAATSICLLLPGNTWAHSPKVPDALRLDHCDARGPLRGFLVAYAAGEAPIIQHISMLHRSIQSIPSPIRIAHQHVRSIGGS